MSILNRRLITIIAIDVVGYSRLMRADEERTVTTLIELRRLIDKRIAAREGVTFGTAGDSVLAEFNSPVEAVRCALEIQADAELFNANFKDDQKMLLRVGANVGDIIERDHALYGDGINIAARLESLCDAGGVCLSDTLHKFVQGRIDVTFADDGEHKVKNIDTPVRVWKWTKNTLVTKVKADRQSSKPSIAVLAFKNMSSDPEQDYFADGIVEEIITALSGYPGLIVIARNSSFLYKGQSIDIQQVGRDLGARYIVEGSVRQSGNRLRIVAQLANPESGIQLWANRYDGVVEDVFELQDEISKAIVGAIAPEIQKAEILRELSRPTDNLDAYDLYLRGLNELHRSRLTDADQWFGQAIESTPDFARAMARKAWISTAWRNYGVDVDDDYRKECLSLAGNAVSLEPNDPEVAAYAGYTIGFLSADPGKGLHHVERATRLCPSFAWAWASSALLNVYLGNASVALECADNARRLSPKDPLIYRTYNATGLANIIKGNMQDLLECAEIGISEFPKMPGYRYHRAIALTELGRDREAGLERKTLLDLNPRFSITEFIRSSREDIGMSDTLLLPVESGLRKSGFPE
ncbi:MAG: adenylate/guanylate cyclase domain-containing protein [Rhizobiaceae bacterium]